MNESEYSRDERARDIVASLEAIIIRKAWWIFPLIGIVIAAACKKWGWFLITKDSSLIAPGFDLVPSGRYLLIVGAVASIPAIWALGINLEKRLCTALPRFPLALFLALAVLFMGEAVMRQRIPQSVFWLAVKNRLGGQEGDFFLREAVGVRLADTDVSESLPNSVVLVGSSQTIFGYDLNQFRSNWPGNVDRRAVGAMFPFRMCAVYKYMDIDPEEIVLLLVSEFDMAFEADILDMEWLRILSNLRGMTDGIQLARSTGYALRWRPVVDWAIASTLELWRDRGAVRRIMNLTASETKKDAQNEKDEDGPVDLSAYVDWQKKWYRNSVENAENYILNQASLVHFIEQVGGSGARVVIVEGFVRPDLDTEASEHLRFKTRSWLQGLADQKMFFYVPQSDLGVSFDDLDWRDSVHFTERGSTKFTSAVIAKLEELFR